MIIRFYGYWISLIVCLWIYLQLIQNAEGSEKFTSSSTTSVRQRKPRKLVLGVDGGTESIRACFFDAKTGEVVGESCAVPYETYHPKPGWAEQNPLDWWNCMGKAVQNSKNKLPQAEEHEICCICVDTTCCSVVALDKHHNPLRNCLLWMDARSAPQTKEMMKKCKGDAALLVNCGGEGPISAEWMTPKALWIQQNEPQIWQEAETICEYQDFINYRLTGNICSCSCNAATRWHWDGQECLKNSSTNNPYPGRPITLYESLGIPELAEKLPRKCIPMGSTVGQLTDEAALHLNLPVGLSVAQGGPDAFVGMVGLGCVNPGQLCLITGSSHLHCVVSETSSTAPGIWGAYRGAPLPGLSFAEGGQSSTGSIIRWARKILGQEAVEYKDLDAAIINVPPGCDGLVALESFQGSRTPITDPLARGALVGLTLSHSQAHIWRAFMEAVAFGTRSCLEGLENAGHRCDEIIIAGGITRSDIWLQMHADVTGKPVVVCEFTDAPLLGCAILASINAGIYDSINDAVLHMVRQAKRIIPSDKAKEYEELYKCVYSQLGAATRPVAHAIADLRGGDGSINPNFLSERKRPSISPSLLACDWANMRDEIKRCIDSGADRLHVDIFDGVFLDSPYALTFGPQMVQAIRKCSPNAVLDLHVCVERPARYIVPLKEAGGNSFIFQWEAIQDKSNPTEAALEIARSVVDSGMDCGISINPTTNVEEIYQLLKSDLIAVVDVLAVDPGFGGQRFQDLAIDKIKKLASFRHDTHLDFSIMVDGGINEETAPKASAADILVAGTFLFTHKSIHEGMEELVTACLDNHEH